MCASFLLLPPPLSPEPLLAQVRPLLVASCCRAPPFGAGTSDCLAVGDFRARLLSGLCSAGGCGFLPVAAGSSDCLAVGTCLRDFFQVGCLLVVAGSFPLVPGPQIAWLLVPACVPSFRSGAFLLLVAAGSFVLPPGPHFFAVGDVPARLVSGRLASFYRWPRAPSCCGRDLTLPVVCDVPAGLLSGWLPTGGRDPVAAGTSLGRFKSGGSWSAQLLWTLLWNTCALDFGWARRRSMILVAAWWRTTDMCTSAWSWGSCHLYTEVHA